MSEVTEIVEVDKLEIDYLRWFFSSADFGPAHGDVMYYMNAEYVNSGGVVPEGYKEEH